MTQILEEAWNSVINLTEERQDSIACIILDEIKDEQDWDARFENSQSKLALIADRVKAGIKLGNFQEKGFGEL